MNLVVDTHALIWYLAGDARRLSARARQAFREAERARWTLRIPAVVLMEIVLLEQKRRIRMDYRVIREQLAMRPGMPVEPLMPDDVDEARSLAGWPDPFDRLIAGTALRLGLPLLTNDKVITSTGRVPTLW